MMINITVDGRYDCTVRCRYNAVNFLQKNHKRHPLSGRDMGCFVGYSSDMYSARVTELMYATSLYVGPCYNFMSKIKFALG